MSARTVLMCGGPANGRWVPVPSGAAYQDVLKTPHVPVRVAPSGDVTADIQADLERVRYRIMPVTILGHELWVGQCENEAYDDRAVMRAILQRDVAQHLGAYR